MFLRKISIAIALLLPLTAQAFLNDADENKPITISAEVVSVNSATGEGTYQHDVKIDQGSTHIRGEKVITQNDSNNKLEAIIIDGTQSKKASYETKMDVNKPLLIASANRIQYFPQKNYVILTGNANIVQGDNSIQGEYIEYDVKQQRMRATAVENDKGEKTRTTIIIKPEPGLTLKKKTLTLKKR